MFDSLAPSSALQLIRFADVDAFRPAESMEDARSIPLDVTNFAAARAIVCLPACRIIVMRSFARILDTVYRAPGGMVILPMSDDLRASSSGIDLDSRFFAALRGSDECHFVEPQTNHHALIFFSPALRDRGWFDRADTLLTRIADRTALVHARQLLLDILRTASVEPHMFETTEVAAHLQEGLLLAFDDLFRIDPLSDRCAPFQGERSAKLVQRIDDYVAAYPTAPIYTANLADAIIHAVLHWQGGDHTQLQVKQRLNAAGRHNPRIPDDTIALVRELARLMPDRQIARLLNRTRVETGHGNTWTQERARGFRNHHDIAVFRDGEWAERGEITLETAAKLIGVCNMTALRMLRRGDIKGRQACVGAPWVIRAEDLAGFAKGKRRKPPLTQNATQQVFDFQ